jgi:hypothetical protein
MPGWATPWMALKMGACPALGTGGLSRPLEESHSRLTPSTSPGRRGTHRPVVFLNSLAGVQLILGGQRPLQVQATREPELLLEVWTGCQNVRGSEGVLKPEPEASGPSG